MSMIFVNETFHNLVQLFFEVQCISYTYNTGKSMITTLLMLTGHK